MRQTSRVFCSEATQNLFSCVEATCDRPSTQPHHSKLLALERLKTLANSEIATHVTYLRFGLTGTGVTREMLDNYLRDIQHLLPAVAPMLTNLDTLVFVNRQNYIPLHYYPAVPQNQTLYRAEEILPSTLRRTLALAPIPSLTTLKVDICHIFVSLQEMIVKNKERAALSAVEEEAARWSKGV